MERGKGDPHMNNLVTLDELEELLHEKDPPLLLDVRRAADRVKDPDMIPGSAWRDPEKVAEWAGELRGGETIIYCVRGGSVSRSVQEQLRQRNIPVRYLEGGLEAWKKSTGAAGTPDT